ncbi:MAG: response regulator [Bacillota bacterium]
MIRVMVVDDHPIVRDGLMTILDSQDDMEVVGEAGDGPAAVACADTARPDVVLMDLQLPGFSGAEATRQIKAARPETKVLVLTAYDTDEGIIEAVRAGASGYLLKGAPRTELIQGVRLVAAGGSLLQPALVARLLERPKEPEALVEPLTEREMEALRLLADGLRNKEIADAMGVAERTAKFYLGIVFQKLGVQGRAEAVAAAFKLGLLK